MGIETLEILHFGIKEIKGEIDEAFQVRCLHAINFSVDEFLLQNAFSDIEDHIGQLREIFFLLLRAFFIRINGVDHRAVWERFNEFFLNSDIEFLEQSGQLSEISRMRLFGVLWASLFHADHENIMTVVVLKGLNLCIRLLVGVGHDVLVAEKDTTVSSLNEIRIGNQVDIIAFDNIGVLVFLLRDQIDIEWLVIDHGVFRTELDHRQRFADIHRLDERVDLSLRLSHFVIGAQEDASIAFDLFDH